MSLLILDKMAAAEETITLTKEEQDMMEALSKMDKGKLKAFFVKLLGPSVLGADADTADPSHADASPGHDIAGAGVDSTGPNTSSTDPHARRYAPTPRLPSFSGSQPSKGDVKYEHWKYHVESLVADPLLSDSEIMMAVRQSLRGQAADVMLFMGQTSPKVLLAKLDAMFGCALEGDSLLKRFYWMEQEEEESVTDWTCRLQGALAEVAVKEDLDEFDTALMLRNQF